MTSFCFFVFSLPTNRRLAFMLSLVLLSWTLTPAKSFLSSPTTSLVRQTNNRHHHHESTTMTKQASGNGDADFTATTTSSSPETLEDIKADLTRCCQRDTKPLFDEVQNLVRELEDVAEQLGVGQCSSSSGLISGEWELLYSPEDVTRSSPFFWAFRKAVPEYSDQIYAITDSIPAPIKEVGPAFQHIEFDPSSNTGRFVSKVKVATLGGMATSVMTTRGSIVGVQGLDGLRLKIETTKPEDSTVVKTLLGPLADMVNENAPPFPSGEALERVQPGSSEVVMRTTFCDDGMRISRNEDSFDDVYVWKRSGFATYDSV